MATATEYLQSILSSCGKLQQQLSDSPALENDKVFVHELENVDDALDALVDGIAEGDFK